MLQLKKILQKANIKRSIQKGLFKLYPRFLFSELLLEETKWLFTCNDWTKTSHKQIRIARVMLYFLRFFEFHIKELSVQFTVNVLISVLSSICSSPLAFGVLGLTKQLRSLQEASGSAFGYQCHISLNQITRGLKLTSLDIQVPVRSKRNTCCFPTTTQAMGPSHSQAWWIKADSTCGYSKMCRPGV